jgi:hypothetical protein
MNERDSLQATLRTLELRLLQPGGSAQDIGDLLATEFVEFGSSGRIYDKRQVIENLQRGTASIELSDFQATMLSPGLALATYVATRLDEKGASSRRSLRSSIWKRIHGHWRMVFHQGTLSNAE